MQCFCLRRGDKGTRCLHWCWVSLLLSPIPHNACAPWDRTSVGSSSPDLGCWLFQVAHPTAPFPSGRSPFLVCVFCCCWSWMGQPGSRCFAVSSGLPHHQTVVTFLPVKQIRGWRDADLHLDIQTVALLRGEKQFSIPSTIGEGSGLLYVLIYSLSGQEDSCSGSFASCYM